MALIFAVTGIIYQRKNRLVYFFLFLSGLSLLFALPTPFSQALTVLHIPVLDTSSPARTLFIFQFSLVVLAGFGIDTYLLRKAFVLKSLFLLVPVYALLWIFTFAARVLPQNVSVLPYLSVIKRNLFVPTMILAITFILIYAGIKYNKFKIVAFFLFLILAGFEYQYFLYKFSPFSPSGYFYPKLQLLSDLKEMTPPDRVYGYGIARMENNLPTEWQIQAAEGYDSLYIRRYGELIDAGFPKDLTRSDANLPETMPTGDSYAKKVLMDVMDLKFILYKNDLAPTDFLQQAWRFPLDRFKRIYQRYKWEIHQNLDVLPRAGIFYDFAVEKDDSKIIGTLFDKNFPYAKKLILEETPVNFTPTINQIPTTAKIVNYKSNEIKIETDTKADGLLFLADNYYPGWTATIDNKPAKIYRANYTFRTIFVKAGKHTVTFSYLPESFIYGALISTLSLIIAAAILLKKNKKKN